MGQMTDWWAQGKKIIKVVMEEVDPIIVNQNPLNQISNGLKIKGAEQSPNGSTISTKYCPPTSSLTGVIFRMDCHIPVICRHVKLCH